MRKVHFRFPSKAQKRRLLKLHINWICEHLGSPRLQYPLGTKGGLVVITSTSPLYNHCMCAEFQTISTWLKGFFVITIHSRQDVVRLRRPKIHKSLDILSHHLYMSPAALQLIYWAIPKEATLPYFNTAEVKLFQTCLADSASIL